MDIDKVSGRIHSTEFAGHGKVKGENTFAQTLDRAMDAVHAEEGPTEATCAVTKAVSDSPCEVSRATRGAMQRASKLLDLLEEYAEALKNPQMTLKSIEPMLIRIQQELRGLDVRPIHHTGQHDELAKLVNHIAVTASVEVFKFQRGDYVA